MPSSDPLTPSPEEVLLHAQFGGWNRGSASDGSSCPSSPGGPSPCDPEASYALTLTHTHLHVQRLSPRPGKEARLLLPLPELLGCSCPRTPAPPLLVLYWYPSGRRRKGVSRRRQVRAYLAESRAEAEKWSAAVQCLLRGVAVSAATEFNRRLLPRPRRLLLLVNPFSGRGQAMQWCQTHILPMIREANISYNLIQTERQNHAKELVREISLQEWDGIVIVSGDGLLHEVINGLMERPDWEQAIKTPVGVLPCGSGNALAGSVNHYAGYDMCLREPLLLNCCFLLCRGGVRPMDLVSVTTSPASTQNGRPAPKRLFSFLSVAWGFVSDVDIESERYRGLGSARFTLGTLVRLASLRSYKGRLSYLPPSAVACSQDGTPPPQKRPLSRSITEGLEGFCRTPIHRTVSDMGLSEQRSLRKDDEEGERKRQQERQERQKERERRRQRGRPRGVTRASSLAEDREREREAEQEMHNSKSYANNHEAKDSTLDEETTNEREDGVKEEDTEQPDSDEREEGESAGLEEEALDGGCDVTDDEKADLGESKEYGADAGREADESYNCCQDTQRGLRKNSAPPSQIASSFLSPPGTRGSLLGCRSSYCDDVDLNGTLSFSQAPYPLDMRERSLTISSPIRHSPLSYKNKCVDQKPNSSRPRPLSLLHSHSNSLPPKLPSLSLSLSPTPPSSPSSASSHSSSYLAPRPGTPGSTSPSPSLRSPSPSFTFDVAEPAGPVKSRGPACGFCSPPTDSLLPPLDQPLPTRDWVTVEGDFVLVLAIYQTHLGADLLAAPQSRFDDGLIHLTFVRAGISRATLLRLFLAMERGAHLSLTSPYVSHVSAKAFRLQPLSPRGTLTVDGELVPYGPLQAQVHPALARLIVGDDAVKITRL